MTATVRPSEITEQTGAPSTAPGAEQSTISPWWRLFGGSLMTLALGTLYGWSVFVAPLEHEFGWKRAQTSTVFTLAVVMFAATLPLAGRLQDRFGPFWISLAGSLMISLSFFLFAYTSSLYYLFFFFGILGGVGNAFGYATVVPVMAKWFPDRMGLAIGLAIAGATVEDPPFLGTLANLVLFPRFGWRTSCVILSGIFLVMTMTAAFLLRNPVVSLPTAASWPDLHITTSRRQFAPGEILRTSAFYLLWLGFGLGSTAGLMVISQLIPFATSQGISSATIATLGLVMGAFGNVSGRILSGWLSDLIGRLNTLRVVLVMSSIAMPALYWVGTHVAGLYLLIFIVYFCYGTQASVNPSAVSDFWGTRHAGANYGSIFTAWGFSGILGPTIGGVLFDNYKNYGVAFYTAAAISLIALICVLAAKRPQTHP